MPLGDRGSEDGDLRRYRAAIARTDALIDPAHALGKTLAEVRARAELRMARLRLFLASLGDPHLRYPVVHVGGTSGKGSTSTAIAAILTAAGYRTGLHTSPYLQVATEKLAIDGRLIAGEVFGDLVEEIVGEAERWGAANGEQLTYGEIWFALVTTHFARERVEVAVIEVGAGGRFDLTNLVAPAVSVITSVGIDHIETLGGTIPEIAWHKAGIIKSGAPVVTAVSEPDALTPILAEAALTRSEVIRPIADRDYRSVTLIDGSAAIELPSGDRFRLGMSGGYQATNAALAIAAVRALSPVGFAISTKAIAAGLAAARLPGRFETVQQGPTVVLDGAHNLQKVGALVESLPEMLRLPDGARRIIVLGVLEAKDHAGIVRAVAGSADELVLTRPRVLAKPGADPATLAVAARDAGFTGPIIVEEEPPRAVEAAIALADATRGDAVLVTGSLYLIGNVRGHWYPDDEIVCQRTAWPEVDAHLS